MGTDKVQVGRTMKMLALISAIALYLPQLALCQTDLYVHRSPDLDQWTQICHTDLLPGQAWENGIFGSFSLYVDANEDCLLFYSANHQYGGTNLGIARTKKDAMLWVKDSANPILSSSAWGPHFRGEYLLKDDGEYKLYYTGMNPNPMEVGLATSSDGNVWSHHPSNPILRRTMQSWSSFRVVIGSVLKVNGMYYAYYYGDNQNLYAPGSIGVATSLDGFSWTPYPSNPIFHYSNFGNGQGLSTPQAVYKDGLFHLYFRDSQGWNHASGTDGIHFGLDTIRPSIPQDAYSLRYDGEFYYVLSHTDLPPSPGTPEWDYKYDKLERLSDIKGNNGIFIRYSYDEAGNRLQKSVYTAFSVSPGPGNKVSCGFENGSSNVLALHLRFQNNDYPALLNSLVFSASGTGNDSTAISSLHLWEDVNCNGLLDSGEPNVGQSSVNADNGTVTFTNLALPFAPNTEKFLLLTCSFNGTASQNDTFKFSLTTRQMLNVVSSAGVDLYTNVAPVEGATLTTSTDTVVPVFDGLDTAVLSANTALLGWNEATDSSSPITYSIWMSESPFEGVVNGAPTCTTQDLTYTIPGLQYSKPYWFLVRASDPSGNQDQNVNETRVLAMPDLCKLTILKDGPGEVEQNPGYEVMEKGASVTLNALPEVGHHFTGWTKHTGEDLGSESPRTLALDESTTVTAHFSVNLYALALLAEHGQVTRNPDLTEYAYGSTVSLTAEPETGYHFTLWSGDVLSGQETQNPLSLQITDAHQITANFAINTYTLSAAALNGTIECSPNATEYEHGTVVTLTAKPNRGLAFLRWTGDVPVENTGDNPMTITMDGDKTVSFETKETAVRKWRLFR